MAREKLKAGMPMSQKNERNALFDDLWEIVKRDGHKWNCYALSDLRYNRRLLQHSLWLVRHRRYAAREWLGLIRYLLWRL